MLPEARRLLNDIRQAGVRIQELCAARSFEDYERGELLRSTVERYFITIGEAVGQLARVDLPTAERIPEHQRIVAFRNALVHGYSTVNNRRVWDAVQERLTALLAEVGQLLVEGGAATGPDT